MIRVQRESLLPSYFSFVENVLFLEQVAANLTKKMIIDTLKNKVNHTYKNIKTFKAEKMFIKEY